MHCQANVERSVRGGSCKACFGLEGVDGVEDMGMCGAEKGVYILVSSVNK